MQNRNVWLKYESQSRPFSTQEEHDNTIINNWNSVVRENDTVYVLGDFIMGNAENVPAILGRLNGQIVLIRGNHDTNAKMPYYERAGIQVLESTRLYCPETCDASILLSHYPPWDEKSEWHSLYEMVEVDPKFFEHMHYLFLYGHIHGQAESGLQGDTFHVGVDTNNLTPVLLDDIIKARLAE